MRFLFVLVLVGMVNDANAHDFVPSGCADGKDVKNMCDCGIDFLHLQMGDVANTGKPANGKGLPENRQYGFGFAQPWEEGIDDTGANIPTSTIYGSFESDAFTACE